MKPLLAWVRRWLPWLVLLWAAVSIVIAVLPPKNPDAMNIEGFARLPVLSGGRLKPLDTVARSTLLQIQHRQTVYLADETELEPIRWLLDVFYRPEVADRYNIFVIDNPDLQNLVGLNEQSIAIHYPDTARQILATFDFVPSKRRRFSYQELEGSLAKIDEQSKLAAPIDEHQRTPFQRAVVELANSLMLYQRLEHAVQTPGTKDFLGELMRFQDAVPAGVAAVANKEANKPYDKDVADNMMKLGERYLTLSDTADLLLIPPTDGSLNGWKTGGQGILAAFQTGRVDPAELAYAGLGSSWRDQDAVHFNELLRLYTNDVMHRLEGKLNKVHVEVRFNAAQPFYVGMPFFFVAFLLAVGAWMFWPESCGRAASWLLMVAWCVTTAGLLARMWIEGRPPVTNLYSSALFIGWGAVALCLVLEYFFRNAIGAATAGVIGFGTLIIAQHLALSGDTMEMMRAVLDSNFWLGTHVVVVTTGYASTFVAGFLALIYVVRGVLTPSLDKDTANALGKMVYGIVCFATLFSFVGTVLGGIWADQSWGRFWGWDPKENGALIIVVWNALILHCRWGGMIRQRGLMVLAIFGNVVTSWSWFGTNMLGIGLHSYGFTTAAFYSLITFVATQLVFIALGLIPRNRWRSPVTA